VFAQLGLRQAGSTAIDVDTLTATLAQPQPQPQRQPGGLTTLQCLARALAGVVAAAPRVVPIRTAALVDHPDHLGARMRGLSDLRTLIATRGLVNRPVGQEA